MDLIGMLRSWSHFNAMPCHKCFAAWALFESSKLPVFPWKSMKSRQRIWLIGGIPTTLKNMSSSVGVTIPNLWKKEEMFQTTNQKNMERTTQQNTSKQPRDQKWCEHLVPHSWQFQHGKWWSTAGKKRELGTFFACAEYRHCKMVSIFI